MTRSANRIPTAQVNGAIFPPADPSTDVRGGAYRSKWESTQDSVGMWRLNINCPIQDEGLRQLERGLMIWDSLSWLVDGLTVRGHNLA